MKPSNPKIRSRKSSGRSHWYPYYAGYSQNFVSDILLHLNLDSEAVVLDPWNGSGTTTAVCSMSGISSHGFDLNPSMVVVAKGRLLDSNTAGSLAPLLETILDKAKYDMPIESKDEPLLAWFSPSTALRLRSIERAIHEILIKSSENEKFYDRSFLNDHVNHISSLAAFYYVLLFRLVRENLNKLITTNPTWMPLSSDVANQLHLSWDSISRAMRHNLNQIYFIDKSILPESFVAEASLRVANSCDLPLDDESIDAIITSPPYCTRIDYAVATRAELAVLNLGNIKNFDNLRRNMIGTTLSNRNLEDHICVTASARDILNSIRSHPSKASSTYYHSTFADYFYKLQKSLEQIERVLKLNGTATLVVQDSSYKDIHIDLAQIVIDSMEALGLVPSSRWDYPVTRSLRQIHTASRGHNDRQPMESALTFRKI